MTDSAQGEFITVQEAAEILGWSTTTMHRRIADGTLPVAQKLSGRTGAYIFRRSDVEEIAATTEASA